jgi:hypothetical protein
MVEFREFTLTRTWACWEIASPALYADLCTVLSWAAGDYRRSQGLGDDDGLPDDFCQIEARDDVLRVSLRRADLETPGTASKPASEDR